MELQQLFALFTFVLVSTASPGPNNIMLMTSGANIGFLRTIPHMLGVTFGFMVLPLTALYKLSRFNPVTLAISLTPCFLTNKPSASIKVFGSSSAKHSSKNVLISCCAKYKLNKAALELAEGLVISSYLILFQIGNSFQFSGKPISVTSILYTSIKLTNFFLPMVIRAN